MQFSSYFKTYFFSRKKYISILCAYTIACIISIIFIPTHAYSEELSSELYLKRFQLFQKWNQQLPNTAHPDNEFIEFINTDKPLSNRLRERWLYQLTHLKEWNTFLTYYKPTSDVGLQCNQQLAYFYTGNQTKAIQTGLKIWLSPTSQPNSCNELFMILTKNHWISDALIRKRIALALEKQNLTMSTFLLKQLSTPRPDEAILLQQINQQPQKILTLSPSTLHSEFYLYGLKRLVSKNIDKSIRFWHIPKTQSILSASQKQAFLAHLTLYKAMRDQPDTNHWFQKINPVYYNETLLEWETRYELKHKHWQQVINLIQRLKSKNEPGWQYWLARAYAATGNKEKAITIYQTLAQQRSYYGFLSSTQLHQNYHFQHENPASWVPIIQAYTPITENIKSLYLSQKNWEASRLLNDFFSELPKHEKAAMASWVANDLHWPVKALYLCNTDELSNQLTLRFPLTYNQLVLPYAQQKNIDPALVYAIIRQESAFRDDVTSPAGAHGLMQLMPQTAQKVAKISKIPYTNSKQLFSPQSNITLGIAYLHELAQHFHSHPLLMVAAYNAGPRQVHYWLKNNPPKDIDIWIDTLPWLETRNYLKNVIAFYAVYQHRLQKPASIHRFMQAIG